MTIDNPPQYPPTIDLGALRLRPLCATDARALYAYLREPVVTELTSYPVVTLTLVETIIERSRNRWTAGELGKWGIALPHDEQIIGTCGFNDTSLSHRWAELAFELAPRYWGNGLMRQAVAGILKWTFQQDRVDRVHAYVRVDNQRSKQLLERMGFTHEGCLRNYRVCRGKPYDFNIYSLLRSEWTGGEVKR